MKPEVTLNTSIESLRKQRLLSGRTYNCLFNAGIFTVADIMGFIQKRGELSKIYNMDRKGEIEIKYSLLQCRFQTGDFRALDLCVKALDYYDLLNKPLKAILEMAFENALKNNRDSANSLPINYPDIQSFFSAIDQGKEFILQFNQAHYVEENISYRRWHINLIGEIIRELEEGNMKGEPIETAFSTFLSDFKKDLLVEPTYHSDTDISSFNLNLQTSSELEQFKLIHGGIDQSSEESGIVFDSFDNNSPKKDRTLGKPIKDINDTENTTSKSVGGSRCDKSVSKSTRGRKPKVSSYLTGSDSKETVDISNQKNYVATGKDCDCDFDCDSSNKKPRTIPVAKESNDTGSNVNYSASKEKDNNSIGNDNTSKESQSIPVRKVSLFASEITHSTYDAKQIDYLLQKRYDRLCDAILSPRAINFKHDCLPCYKDVMPYLDKTLDEFYRLCPGLHMGTTLYELHQMVQFLRTEVVDVYENFNRGWDFDESIEFEEFNNFYNKDFKDLKADYNRGNLHYINYTNLYSVEKFHDYINKKLYPYLDKSEYGFVKNFTEQHGVRPIFFLAYKALPHTHSSACRAFCIRYGLDKSYNSFELPVEEVARRLRLTSEETLDLINGHDTILKDLRILPKEKENYRNYRKFTTFSNLITEASPEASAIITEEQLPEDFRIFSPLFSLIFDYELSRVEGYLLLISPTLAPDLVINGALGSLITDFEQRYKKGVKEDVLIPFTEFNGNIPKEFNKELVTVFSLLAQDKDAVTVKEGGVLFSVNIDEEVFRILRKQGTPLPIEVIFSHFKEEHPKHEFWKPSQLAEHLRCSNRIKKVENHNLYGLPGWSNKVFYGSIRDLLHQSLKKSKLPMLAKDLFNVVRQHFPSTTLGSVRTTMLNDSKGRFVKFEGDYYGLSNKKYPEEYVQVKSRKDPEIKPLEECSFDEIVIRIETFIQKNQRLPLRSGAPEEVALRCCLYNEKPYKRKLTEEEAEKLKAIIKKYSDLGYPTTLAELKFLQRCQEYKRFVKEHKAEPGSPNSWILAAWFRNNLYEYSRYKWHKDKRVNYLLDLVSFLESQGFKVDLPENKKPQ